MNHGEMLITRAFPLHPNPRVPTTPQPTRPNHSPTHASPCLWGLSLPRRMSTVPGAHFRMAAACSCVALRTSCLFTSKIWSPCIRRPSPSATPPSTYGGRSKAQEHEHLIPNNARCPSVGRTNSIIYDLLQEHKRVRGIITKTCTTRKGRWCMY